MNQFCKDKVLREAVNTACYVLNWALVTKPHNKTPYELIRGRPPLIDFMKPFGCPVTILNTRDNLGKFEGKADEGYFVRNQTNGIAGSKENLVAGQDDTKKALEQEYIMIPIYTTDPLFSQGSKDSTVDAGKKAPEVDESEASDNGRKNDQVSRSEVVEGLPQQARQTENINSPNSFNTVSLPVNTVGSSFVNAASQTPINAAGPSASTNVFKEHYFEQFFPFKNAFSLLHVPIVTPIDDTDIFGNAFDDEVLEEEFDMNNVDSSYTIPKATKNKKDERGIVIKNKARLVAQGHTQEEGVDYDEVLWIQNQMLDYGFNLMNTKIYIDNESTICIVKNQATVKALKVNDQEQMQALVDKTKVIITKDNIRSDLRLDDAEGTACLLNEVIFKGLARMGTMASAIICLADNQKFNFSKYIFDNMVKSLDGGVKFYLFLGFLQVFLDKQVEGMARHKEMYVISSHNKKIFANIRRIRAGFSGNPQKLRRKKRKEAETSHDKSKDEDHVPTPSSDPLPIGDDSSILNELMKKVTKLTKWRKLRFGGLKRLKRIGSGRRVKSPMEKDDLGAQEDASKQGRMIEEIDQNAEIALDDETQGRTNDDEMFRVDDLAGEEVVMDSAVEPVTTIKDSAATTTDVTEDEITIDQALAALRSKGIVFYEQTQSQIPTVSSSKDKVKAKIIEPEVPLKKKDQMRIDAECARKLQAEEQEAATLSRAQ
nr:retrovirus-related Pol polyprotein from transposon TNT 1-94 [Tanacetum cinerariifolium]